MKLWCQKHIVNCRQLFRPNNWASLLQCAALGGPATSTVDLIARDLSLLYIDHDTLVLYYTKSSKALI